LDLLKREFEKIGLNREEQTGKQQKLLIEKQNVENVSQKQSTNQKK
jgi:hypothetical protein